MGSYRVGAMTLQNRVDPYGELRAVPERGTWMGNRGVLHDASRRIVARWRSRRWITCVLSFRGRRREVFTPHRYSELFFLDEATSLAAGHRPCAECRRSRYEEFCAAWAGEGHHRAPHPGRRADAIDRVLHAERVREGGRKNSYEARVSSLPSGTMVEHEGRPHLYWEGALYPWSFAGYAAPIAADPASKLKVLTPKSAVRAIRAGFLPQVHPSVRSRRERHAASRRSRET
jgi:hypothetical protein